MNKPWRIVRLAASVAVYVVAACVSSCGGERDTGAAADAGSGIQDASTDDAGAQDGGGTPALEAAAARVEITPTEYELFRDCGRDDLCPGDVGYPGPDEGEGNVIWDSYERFLDCGTDRLCDPDEPGYDAITNPDPAGDDFDKAANPGGTEKNGVFDAVFMGGFQGVVLIQYTGKPVQGVHDPLYAKILVLRQGDELLVIVAMDVIGLMHKYVNALKRMASDATGIPKDNIVVSSLHNHEGPDTMGIWSPPTDMKNDNKGVNQRYILKVLEDVTAAVKEAAGRLEPVRLFTADAWLPACVDRATGALKRHPDCAEPPRTALALDPAYDEPILARDSRDPYVRDMQILAARFESVATGATVATLVNWNNHPESLGSENPLVSADFPGYLRQFVEHRLGGEAVFVNGALGGMMTPLEVRAPAWNADFTPAFEEGGGGNRTFTAAEPSFEKAMGIGFEAAAAAWEALEAAGPAVTPRLAVRTVELEVPVSANYRNLFTFTEYLHPRDNTYEDPGSPSLSEAEKTALIERCGQNGCVKVPLHVITIGDVQIATFPGEAFTEYAVGRTAVTVDYAADDFPPYAFPAVEGLRAGMCGSHNMIFGLTEHELGYAVPVSDFLSSDNPGAVSLDGKKQYSDHPNYYEESVSAHLTYGDTVYRALRGMIAEACGN